MADLLKKTIIQIARLQLGETFLDNDASLIQQNVEGIEFLREFLENENDLVLCVFLEKNGNLKFSKTLPDFECEKTIVFSKRQSINANNEDFLKLLQFNTVTGTPTLDLYEFLNKIFTPKLQKHYNKNIKRKIFTLQTNLRTLILTENAKYPIEQGNGFPLTFVNSIEDELKYWDSVSSSKADKLTRKSAENFIKCLNSIAKDFSIIESLPINEVEDLLERSHNTLDDLWRCDPSFSKERIKNLMDIIGHDLWKVTLKQFSECDIWKDEFNKIIEKCVQSLTLGEKWLTTCKQLTGLFWPNYSGNPWKDDVYQPGELVQFVTTIREVMSIRTVHKQLLKLSTVEEQSELDCEIIFKPFKDLEVFTYEDTISNDLLKARKEFEYLLQPAEEKVALKLKKQLMSINANTRQLIYEFTRYSELINRPVVKKSLHAERQLLLNSLNEYVAQIQSQSNLETSKIITRQETSETIKELIFIRQLEAKANEVLFVLEKLLQDLDGYNGVKEFVLGVVTDLKAQHSELFDAWSSDVVADIKNNKLSLKETGPVIQFSKDKLMKVNYPSRLITLISEIRQLKAMGYNIPSLIDETSDHAKKFMKFARILEQIANFHNTIGDRMIPSQKPMMLISALELSKLVQEQEVVSWGQEKHVEKYVNTLKKTVEKLSQSNNLLTSFHIEIIDKIRDLENVSLLKELARWNETIKNIKNITSNVENKGYKNLQSWKTEIDTKICEVLEKEYSKNLKSLHLSLEEIRVDLIYRNSALDFSPNKEILEQMYEQQLKKYLNIPKSFKGISDSSENIYSRIIDRNQDVLANISKEKEQLFTQLDAVIKHWQSWLQLEPLDAKKLTSWQHWDLHFRASKTFGQEIAKLPSTEERVGCFLIGLSRLRSDLESHNRSYWDQLVYSLKDSIAQDVVKLQNYIDPSTAALTKQPVTLEEIGQSGFNYSNITAAHEEMEITFKEMLNKSQTLASWSREQVDSVNRLKGAWERLGSLISNQQHIMAKQMETIRTSLNIQQENLLKEIERFEAKWTQINTIHKSFDINENTIEGVNKLFQEIKAKRAEWGLVLEKKEALYSNYVKFNMEKPDIVIISEVENSLKEDETSWAIFEEFNLEFQKFCRQYWIVFRKKYYEIEDFIKSWEEKFSVEKSLPKFMPVVLQDLQKYKDIIPTLKYVKGEDFSEKHWNDVFSILKIEPKPIDQILLKDFLDAHENIKSNSKELQSLCKKAASEIVIRQALKDIDQWEVQTKFLLNSHSDSNGKMVMLVKEFKEILNAIGDHQILLQSLKHSNNFDAFAEKTNSWEIKLENLNGYLNSLAHIQKKWLYLQPIFGSGTLAQEKSRFDRLDRDFRKIMSFIEKDTRVTEICKYPNLKDTLKSILDQLSRCQHSLDAFLKEKRDIFSRFLFLSDDDLLEIIGQSSKEQVIQSHLKKLFAGIHSVQLDSAGDNIIAMRSLHGETVRLGSPIEIKRPVEVWLGQLVKEMQSALKDLLVSCQRETQAPDPLKYPSQILCLSDNISFTLKCEQAISGMSLPGLLAKYKAQLNELSSLELNNTPDSTKSDESNVLELKLKSLLLDTIHHIRILEELLQKNVTKVTEWEWQKQLRYYTNSVGDVTVKMAKARINYSYEYLGNEQKLVRTPLTERCFLTLTQAMHLGLGGNPYGPAGTGKTESVKALGTILGRQVLVFNCDEGIDSNSMERILTGLVKTGAWGCFDEFNRLDETTLSAISMQIHAIQEALRNNLTVVKLADQEVPIDKHCGIFVTLNPAGAGYGGRNKLPDNLKQLFRPVVMTHPDHEEIARTSLHCDGYRFADSIAKKIVEVFEMSRKLLSKQQHYDWGLRAIKTVLSGCQIAIKNYDITNKNLTKAEELGLVVSTLKMDITSKLTFSDTQKFNQIIANIFRNVLTIENSDIDSLKEAILETYKDLSLIPNDRQINKCLEFYKQLKQRMGVAIIGPPSSGKSTIIKIVTKAITKLQQKIKIHPVNPKGMPRQLLLGYMDHLNQWNDGVLTSYSLQVSSEPDDVWSWIICDGDIDPEWVESLNSVLDDNRIITLPSGWRIHFGPNVNFIFETHDLKNASPATISRMGIVYLSHEDVNFEEFLKTTLDRLSEDKRGYLEVLLGEFFVKAINWSMSEAEFTLNRSIISIAKSSFVQLLDVKNKYQFIVGLINGLGQQLKLEFRQMFAEKVFDWTDETPPTFPLKLYYDQDRETIETYHTDPKISVDNIDYGIPLIKTGQILKYLDILKAFLAEQNQEHLLIVGPHGSGKRLMVQHLLNDHSDVELIEINCSSNLSTNYVIHKLQQQCISVSTFKGTTLKPKKGNLVLYFRNLDLLTPDVWGSNTVIEFLSQLIEYKGYFNNKTEFIQVENVSIIGSLMPNDKMSSRFLSKLHMISIELPDKEDLSVILVAYMSAIMKACFPASNLAKTKIVKLVLTMMTIYDKVQEAYQNFRPTSPHDLVQWCTNLKYYSNTDISNFEAYLLEVLCYEALNIFVDRLSQFEEKMALIAMLDEVFRINWETIGIAQQISNTTYYAPRIDTVHKRVIFDKYSKENWQFEVQRGINQFGKENQELETIINDEILLLTSAIMRSAVIPQYHLLLVGKPGIGRKTSLKIASALLSKRIIHPPSGSFPLFHNDLKLAIQYAGIECEDVFLILEDHIFVNEQNMTLINLLMSSGEVPELYSDIEMDSLVKGLKDKLDSENFEGELIQFFANNIKKYLHVFVCLDQDNINLRDIILKCPAFSQNSGLIWLGKWSDDTMKMFPEKLIEKLGSVKGTESGLDYLDKIYKSLTNATPSRYISLIKLYWNIYKDKEMTINAKIEKLEGGVSKLTTAKDLVSELKQKAAEQQEKLAEKQEKANAALDMISNTIKGANAHKEEMEVLKQKTENENVQLVKRKAEIEEELSEVEPLIQEARSAVGNIKTESLSEIRSLRAPPEIIRDILEGVLKLMGTQDTSWNSMKIFLAKRGVKEEIRSFDATRIQTENRQAVERLMATKKDSFDQKSAKRASVAAAPLAAWVDANVKYSRVLDKIRPLEREQNKLKQNLNNAESQLSELNANLSDVDATVLKLKEQLSQYTKEAAEIEIGLNGVNQTLSSAENLVHKLKDEYLRWQEQLEELSKEIQVLPSDSLLAATFITFLSEEEENKRRNNLSKWCTALGRESFDFMSFFTTERDQLQWQSEGLSNDKVSLENAVVIEKGYLSPLLVDPNSSAISWLKVHHTKTGQNFDHITSNSSKFNTILEASIRFGKTLLIEELEEVPHSLYPILRGDYIYQGERKMIRLQGRQIDCHTNFKLIMCSRNERIQLSADIAPYICVLNFNVTYSGFIEQLLSSAITQEKPELESRRKQLLHENEELQEKLYVLQSQLLDCLAKSDGNILNNKDLLTTLNETKSSSMAVADALNESNKIRTVLRKEFEIFLDISSFGSKLYFACKEFTKYDVLYSLSTKAYSRLFLICLQTIQSQQENPDLQKKHLFQIVYNYMSRGMFKNDRLSFFFHSVYRMFPNDIPEEEMNIFLDNVPYQETIESSDLPSWIPPLSIPKILNLKTYLPNVYAKAQLNERTLWSSFMESTQLDKDFPKHCQLSEFKKLLLIQALRPVKLLTCIENCCLRISGLRTVDPPVLSLQFVLKESNPQEPILLVTTSGMDPSIEIRDLARQLNHGFVEIAMGQGKESKALESLEECRKSGSWLILKNLHLVTYWLPSLAQNLRKSESVDNFRLWLISESTEKFNSVLSQNSLKIAYEEPQGIGNNMQRIYSSLGEKYNNKLNRTSARLFFVFACLHALVQERRKYVPQGWSKYYEFNHTDMQTSLSLTEDFWNVETTRIQWQFIKGLLNDAVYGGRIENIDDISILEAYLKIYFKDEVLSHKWKPYGLNLSLPNTGHNKEYLQIIKQFPNKDHPSMFGLPENIDEARENHLSLKLIQQLKGFYQNQTPKDINFKELYPYFNKWKKLNQEGFVYDEYAKGINLIQIIHKCFMILNKISKGTIEADDNYIEVAKCILKSQTPKSWLDVWNGPKDPSQYLQEVLQKTIFLSQWKSANIDNLMKQPVKLSMFFNPETYLACTKQDFARSSQVSLEDLILRTTWNRSSGNAIILSDLLIEGGLLENDTLRECKSDSGTINLVPNCYLSWIEKGQTQTDDLLEFPLYTTSNRDQKIVNLQVECDVNLRETYTLSGLAFYLNY
ncbi:unnamed protein product [Ceutorhynchus assimilis]|uniref:Cytoplasmic dynein 2 heavy chain 1 n=1 Tax=Ceutorhynchus assimilis TaxID=467358 RepID=A0A9N9QMZ9_9CUCU|nr:unnamed protein product [Ceutorhynchus assimilis]